MLTTAALPSVARAAPSPTPTATIHVVPTATATAVPTPLKMPTATVVSVPDPTPVAPTPDPTAVLPIPDPAAVPTSQITPAPAPQANASVARPSPGVGATLLPSVGPSSVPSAGPTEATLPTSTAEPAPTDDTQSAEEPAQDWHAFVPTDTADHLATMDRAARGSGCGVPWQLLAAIARVESDFGRNMATSSAGAIGYGQFLPSSWQTFGNEGNAYDYRDALPAIASYLCQSGLSRDPRAALFAYNHADWYVDLVLALAVRYDRMAPGGPTPEVLDTGPTNDAGTPLHYAPVRDIALQLRPRSVPDKVMWLGVPWRGRAPGTPIQDAALHTTSLSMLQAAFGLKGDPPAADGDEDLIGFTNRGWFAGLLPLDLYDSLSRQRGWSIFDVRKHLAQGEPVVALVRGQALPGHSGSDPDLDEPVVLVGETPDGLVYNDPSFSSSLGYGLVLSDHDFEVAWQAASVPHQAVAFTRAPRPLAREAHIREADPGEAIPRMTATPTATPARPTATPVPPTPTALVVPTAEPTSAPEPVAAPVNAISPSSPPPPIAPVAPVAGTIAALALGGALFLKWRR